MKLDLQGKSVLITGASKGIGLASAWAFAREGCALHLAARSAELLDIDARGHLCGLTLEHARDRADIPHVTFEQVAA